MAIEKGVCVNEYSRCLHVIQLMALYVLYYEFDFTARKLTNFQGFVFDLDYQCTADDTMDSLDLSEDIEKKGWNTIEVARRFPFRAKQRMGFMIKGKQKTKNLKRSIASTELAISWYFIVAIKTLQDHYRFSKAKIRAFIEAMEQTSRTYADYKLELKDLEYYLTEECGLKAGEKKVT